MQTPRGDRPWLPIAYGEERVKEIAGSGTNPRIVEYLHSAKVGALYVNEDETASCSAFVNWCVEKAGHAGTDSAAAASWASWGTEATAPVHGDIVVFNWGGGHGHVGFFVSATSTIAKVLAGNLGNKVDIKDWLREKVYRIRKPHKHCRTCYADRLPNFGNACLEPRDYNQLSLRFAFEQFIQA